MSYCDNCKEDHDTLTGGCTRYPFTNAVWPSFGIYTIHDNKAVLCPVCNGKGQINNVGIEDTCAERWETCHGCNGKGWVVV